MATTAFHPGGYPGRPYGSFAGKETSAAGPASRITTAWPYGGPGHLYGSFAGKEASAGAGGATRITTLWAYGGPGHLYGSFAGKEEGGTPPAPTTTDWLVHHARRRGRR